MFQGVPVLESEIGRQVVVRAVIGRVLTQKPEWVEPTYVIMTDAIALVDDDVLVTLDNLTTYVISKIPMEGLTFEEKDLISLLITETTSELRKKFVEDGVTDPSAQLMEVRQVLTWIRQTAEIRRT